MTNPTIKARDLRHFLAQQLAQSRRAFHLPRNTPYVAGYLAAERGTVAAMQHQRDIRTAKRHGGARC